MRVCRDTAQSQLKRLFGGLTFAEALASQETINENMRAGVSQTYEKWGLHVERIELQDLRPKATSNTATAMKKQMIAERSRRSEFIQAEGNKAAMRLRSEGFKIVKANLVRAAPIGGCECTHSHGSEMLVHPCLCMLCVRWHVKLLRSHSMICVRVMAYHTVCV